MLMGSNCLVDTWAWLGFDLANSTYLPYLLMRLERSLMNIVVEVSSVGNEYMPWKSHKIDSPPLLKRAQSRITHS